MDISSIPRDEQYRYLIDNKKVCFHCKTNKKLTAYVLEKNLTLRKTCKTCTKKIHQDALDLEAIKQVFGILNKSGFEL
jgi:superfamily II helicase